MLASEFDWEQKHQEGDDDLFMEDSDKIKQMIDVAVKEQMQDLNTKSEEDNNSTKAMADIAKEYAEAFKEKGFTRKESVYLAGQLINGYASGFSSLLGGLAS